MYTCIVARTTLSPWHNVPMDALLEWDTGMAAILYYIGRMLPGGDMLIVGVGMYATFALAALGALWLMRAVWLKDPRVMGIVWAVCGALVARFGITEVLQFIVARERPYMTLNLDPLILQTDYSFPSGHATFFFALAMGLMYVDRRLGLAFFGIAAAISVARIMAGVHYPFDILGGALVGILTSAVVMSLRGLKSIPRRL